VVLQSAKASIYRPTLCMGAKVFSVMLVLFTLAVVMDASKISASPGSGGSRIPVSDPIPLSITTLFLPAVTAGNSYGQVLAATGGTPPYTWAVTSGALPAGLTLTSGVISGIPSVAGTFNFTVTVTDSVAAMANRQFSILINPALIPLNIVTSSMVTGATGAAYSQSLSAIGGTPPYTWSLTSGALPAGLTLATSVISGTPSVAGTFSFTVTVTDSASATVSRAFSILVNPGTLSMVTTSLPAGFISTFYTQTLSAAGGTPPYTWSLLSGTLPGGLALSTAGLISGTPSAVGSFTFTVSVSDSAAAIVSRVFSIVVGQTSVSLSIVTSSLSAGMTGTAYSQTLSAAGGTLPYTWSLTSGALPAGLTLTSGVIFGIPSVAGTFSFTVNVTDSVAATASRVLSVTISAQAPQTTQPAQTTPPTSTPATTSATASPTVTISSPPTTSSLAPTTSPAPSTTPNHTPDSPYVTAPLPPQIPAGAPDLVYYALIAVVIVETLILAVIAITKFTGGYPPGR
jgi:hypothetical protein